MKFSIIRLPPHPPADTILHAIAYVDMLAAFRRNIPDDEFRDLILDRYIKPVRERMAEQHPGVAYRLTADGIDIPACGEAVAFCCRPVESAPCE